MVLAMEFWELATRERIRDTLGRYNWSGDALRLDELAETFCEDGELELRGSEPVRGRGAIVALLGGVVASLSATRAGVGRSADRAPQRDQHPLHGSKPAGGAGRLLLHVFTEMGLDHYGRYRDVFVPVGGDWLIRHRFVSTDWCAPDSTMAR